MKDCTVIPVELSLSELSVMDSMDPKNPEITYVMGQIGPEAMVVLPSVHMLHLQSVDCVTEAVSVMVYREVACPICVSAGGVYRAKGEHLVAGQLLAPGKYYISIEQQAQPKGLEEKEGQAAIDIILEPIADILLRVVAANKGVVCGQA